MLDGNYAEGNYNVGTDIIIYVKHKGIILWVDDRNYDLDGNKVMEENHNVDIGNLVGWNYNAREEGIYYRNYNVTGEGR
jgi:hypothetical protein